jgi:hypothetical protein
MNPANDQLPLRDVHLPDPVSWWPTAPGWWLLKVIVIMLVILAVWLGKKRRHPAPAKLAMGEFDKLRSAFENHGDKKRLVREISVLLRRTCMTYTAREQSAALTGDAWIEQLNTLGETPVFDQALAGLLLNAPYNRDDNIDEQALLNVCRQWLQSLPARPKP